jgi:aspartate/methionine/tyrosine aminotransferase
MPFTEPWSKKHKRVTKASAGGVPFSLSNSYAQPLTMGELAAFTRARGDQALLDEFANHALGYTANGGSADLREEIAKLYGAHITAEHVLVFAGAQVALQTAALALAQDCHSIVFTPGYQSTVEAPTHAGSTVTRIELSAARGWQIDPAAVEAAIVPGRTRYMVINEPYNPAGTLMSKERQAALVALARRHGITILSDEVYRLLEHDASDRLPAMADLYERGISAVTMSKPWGACGVTIGWLAFADKAAVRQRLVDVQYFGTACPSRAAELQAMMVLRSSDAILARNLAVIRRNVGRLAAFVGAYPDLFTWVRPKAGAVAFLRFEGPLTSEELGRRMAAAGIGMKPAYCFTSNVTPDNDCFRVGYGEEIMPKALDAFTAFVEEHKQAWREAMAARSRL